MTTNSFEMLKILIDIEDNRLKGEISSKKGRDYEDKASFYILERFNNITKVKSKISRISFNGIEDLDIFDDEERIFTFQIKKNKNIWENSDFRLSEFIIRCIKRNLILRNLNYSKKIRFYFFTNKTGKILEEWKKYHQKFPDKLIKILPTKVKKYLKENLKSFIDETKLFSNIFFIVDQRDSFLNMYLDNKLLQKFREFKNKFKPHELINIAIYNDTIFYEKRIQIAHINEPTWEPDILISNTLEMKLNSNLVYNARLKQGISKNDILLFLKSRKVFMSFFIRYGKIFSFQNFINQNPLIKFIENESSFQKIEFKELLNQDKVLLLNDWLYNYLCSLNLRYYRLKNKRIFYFYRKRQNKYIYWRDPSSSKRKEWKVVQNRGTYYLNVAAEISAKCYNDCYVMVINPCYLFSEDGENILEPDKNRIIETRYRRNFMKNDFLRRWFYMILSFIKEEESQNEQISVTEYFKENKIKNRRRIKKFFFDKDAITLKEPFIIRANFRPNNERGVPINFK